MRRLVHDAVADAVARKYPSLIITAARVATDPWKIKVEGGTKADRVAALAYAKQYAEGWMYNPGSTK